MRVLIIGKIWPEPTSSAAGKRTLDIIESLHSKGWEIHFACAAQKGEFSANLEVAYAIETHAILLNDSSFDEWIKKLSPDTVIFDRYMTEEQYGWRVERTLPETVRVVDTSDLHSLREARHQKLKTGKEIDFCNAAAYREIASILRNDLSLIISEFELDLLLKNFPIAQSCCAYLPFFVDTPTTKAPTFDDRAHFAMIGSFLHEPNWDAVQYCHQEIWPLIRSQIPDAQLHVYGSYPPEKAYQLHKPENGFLIKGRANDAVQTLEKYRGNLAPLRFGAGLKGKLFDAFLAGTPSVATAIAAEGICGEFEWGSSIADSSESFAATAIELYQSEQKWIAAQNCGYKILTERFSKTQWIDELPKLLGSAHEELDQNRRSNFIGQMLRHHSHRSSEYMSRWIEEKNRPR